MAALSGLKAAAFSVFFVSHQSFKAISFYFHILSFAKVHIKITQHPQRIQFSILDLKLIQCDLTHSFLST